MLNSIITKQKMIELGKKLAPITFIFIIATLYLYPAFSGYSLKQPDIVNWKGMAQESFHSESEYGEIPLWTNSMFGGMPTYQISADYAKPLNPFRKLLELFTPHPVSKLILCGLCFYLMLLMMNVNRWASLLGSLMYTFSTYFIIIIEAGHNSKIFALGIWPLVFGSVYVLFNRNRLWGGLLLAVSLGLNIMLNHYQITYYLALCVVIYCIYLGIKALKSNQLIPFLYNSGVSVIAVIFAILMNSGPLFSTLNYTPHTTRGGTELTIDRNGNSIEDIKTSGLDKDYALSWSYGIQESVSLLIPNIKGGGSGSLINSQQDFQNYGPQEQQALSQVYSGKSKWPTPYVNSYWGNQRFTSGPVYLGAIVFLFGILFLALSKNSIKWPLLIISILSLTLAWGKNFMPLSDFFLDYIPGYNKFRSVSMTLVILEFTFPLMAILFLKELIEGKIQVLSNGLKKKTYTTVGVLIGIVLILTLFPQSILDFSSNMEKGAVLSSGNPQLASVLSEIEEIRVSIFQSDAWRTLAFLSVGIILLFLFEKRILKAQYLVIALIAVVLIDLYPVNQRYLNNEKVNGKYLAWEKSELNKFPVEPTQADLQILNKEIQENNLQDEVQNSLANYRKSLDKRRKLNKREEVTMMSKVVGLNTNYRVANFSVGTFNDATTSFYHKSIGGYHGAKLQRYQDMIEFYFSGGLNQDVLAMMNVKYIIQNTQNGPQAVPFPARYGNAWFIDSLAVVSSPNEEIMKLGELELNHQAVVDEDYSEFLSSNTIDLNAEINLVSYQPDNLKYNVSSNTGGVLVFSEIFYPKNWKAYIDGKEVPASRVNYILRAIQVPSGMHSIEWKYVDEQFNTFNKISYASFGVIMLFAIFLLVLRVREKTSETK